MKMLLRGSYVDKNFTYEAMATTRAGRRFEELKSENGKGSTTTSPLTNLPMPSPPWEKATLLTMHFHWQVLYYLASVP